MSGVNLMFDPNHENYPTIAEAKVLVELSIGRILRLGSRPAQPGDIEDYEHCKAIIEEHGPRVLNQ